MFDYTYKLSDIERKRVEVLRLILRDPRAQLILYRGKFYVQADECTHYALTPSGIGLASVNAQ